MCVRVYMPRNNVSHQCYISCNISLFFQSIELLRLHFFHTRTVFCFVLFCICRAHAYETLIWYCFYCFILSRKDAQLWRKLNAAKDGQRENTEKEWWKKDIDRRGNRHFHNEKSILFVWIKMKWITFVHVLIKSFLTCYIFHARFISIFFSYKRVLVYLCVVHILVLLPESGFWNVLLLFWIPVPLISPKNHTIIKWTHSEIKLLLLNNEVIYTENIVLIYVLLGGCISATIRLVFVLRWFWV